MRRSLILIPVVLSTLALTACVAPAPEPTATVTETVTPSPSTSPSSSPSSTAQVDPNAPAGQCADNALAVDVKSEGAGAGNLEYAVVFRNTGDTPCELRGFPGVSVVSGGAQVGASAEETSGAAVETITIEPGASISAPLRAVNVGDNGGPLGDACQATTGDAWQIYPPHSFVPVEVSSPGLAACANASTNFLTVSPVAAG